MAIKQKEKPEYLNYWRIFKVLDDNNEYVTFRQCPKCKTRYLMKSVKSGKFNHTCVWCHNHASNPTTYRV